MALSASTYRTVQCRLYCQQHGERHRAWPAILQVFGENLSEMSLLFEHGGGGTVLFA